jgi:hypothetical protein
VGGAPAVLGRVDRGLTPAETAQPVVQIIGARRAESSALA